MRQNPPAPRPQRSSVRTTAFLIAYAAVIATSVVVTIVSALAHIRVLGAVSLPDLVRGMLAAFIVAGLWLPLRPQLMYYREAWRTRRRRWWVWALPVGLLLIPLGFGGSILAALLHEHLPDAVGLACFVCGFVAAFLGVGVWGAGGISMALDMRRSRHNAQ